MTNTRHDDIIKAVSDSWDFWLSQHDVTVPRCIEDAVDRSVSSWLDENTDFIDSAVYDAMREWLAENADQIIAAIAAATRRGRLR